MLKQFSVYLLSFIICIMFLFGCENQEKMKDPKASLEKVAEEYWQKRLIDKDYEFTYNLEQEQESIPFPEYLKKVKSAGQIEILSIKTKEVVIDQDKGTVTLTATCRVPTVRKEFQMPLPNDLWILESNQWKHKLPEK
jgi:hypothetical protein